VQCCKLKNNFIEKNQGQKEGSDDTLYKYVGTFITYTRQTYLKRTIFGTFYSLEGVGVPDIPDIPDVPDIPYMKPGDQAFSPIPMGNQPGGQAPSPHDETHDLKNWSYSKCQFGHLDLAI
jgi:hypothetical protein